MCNLSQGIEERGIAIGEERGEERGKAIGEANIIINMYKKGFTVDQIAAITDKSIEVVQAILAGRKPVIQ